MNMRIMPIKKRKPPRLSSAGSPVAAKGNAKMNSNSPRKNVRSGFQEDFGVATWTDKAVDQRQRFFETRIVTFHILSR